MEGLSTQRVFRKDGPSVIRGLFVEQIIERKEVVRVCPMTEKSVMPSWGNEPERRICPLCGAVCDYKGPRDWKDPEWTYTHPITPQRMIEAHVILFAPADDAKLPSSLKDD